MQRSALCRSRRELSNAYLLAKFGFDTAENEPCQVSSKSSYQALRALHGGEAPLSAGAPVRTLGQIGMSDPAGGGMYIHVVRSEKLCWKPHLSLLMSRIRTGNCRLKINRREKAYTTTRITHSWRVLFNSSALGGFAAGRASALPHRSLVIVP